MANFHSIFNTTADLNVNKQLCITATFTCSSACFSSYRLSDKDDRCDELTASLQSSEEDLNILHYEKSRADKEGQSSLSKLTLALKEAKQTSSELTKENEKHKHTVWYLAKELEGIKWEKEKDTIKVPSEIPGTPVHHRGRGGLSNCLYGTSLQIPCSGATFTPTKAIPEETQIGVLQMENTKLKQELSCLHTNFQLTSEKSAQMRSEAKLRESNLTELQSQFDKVLDEKESIFCQYQQILRHSQKNQTSDLLGEVETLRDELFLLREEMEELRANNESLETAQTSLENDISSLNKENQILSHDLCRETKKGEEMVREMTIELEVKESKVQALESDLQAQRTEYGILKGELVDMELDLGEEVRLQTSLEESLNLKVRSSEEKDFLLRSEFEEAEREETKERELSTPSNQKVLELEAKLDAANHAVLERESTIAVLKCTNELMDMENCTLLSQVTSLSEMISTRNLKLECQQTHMFRHEEEVQTIMGQISELEAEHGGCGAIIRQLSEKNNALTAKNHSLAMSCSELEDQAFTQRHELESKTSSLMALQAELKHAVKVQESDKMEMKGKMESTLSKMKEVEQKSEDIQRQNTYLKYSLLDMDNTCSDLVKEKEELSERFEHMRESALTILESASLEMSDVNIENQPEAGTINSIIEKEPTKKLGLRNPLQNITMN